jgi:ketosteroid isomerase-like protein
MSRRSLTGFGILAITLATACARAAAPVQPDTIIALERGALDRWGRGDPQGYLDLYARDVTYFDPMREKRIDGFDAMKQALEPIKGLVKIDQHEMIAPQVYRAGDAAILTYNLVSYGRSPV